MAVGFAVLAAGDVNPEVLAVGSLKDELVEVGIALQPVEPLTSGLKVSVPLIIIPCGIAGEGQADVSSFAQGVLGGVGSTYTDVQLVTAITAGDNHRAANKATERLQHLFAQLL